MMKPLSNESLISRQSVAITNCLEPLLAILNWPGERHHLMDALPYYASTLELCDFIRTMEVLNYQSQSFKIHLKNIDPMLMPCLFIADQSVMVIIQKFDDKLLIFDGISNQQNLIPFSCQLGTAYFFTPVVEQDAIKKINPNWFGLTLRKFSGLFYQSLFIGLFLNIFALSIPIFSMAIYNQVIATGSLNILAGFTIGILIAISGMIILQRLQTNLFAHIGARINTEIGNNIFTRLLFLPAQYTEGASISAQVSRIRDFDNIHEFFTSPLMSAIFELPFIVIFILVMAALGGWIAIIPVIMIALFCIIYSILHPFVKRSNSFAALDASVRQEVYIRIATTCTYN